MENQRKLVVGLGNPGAKYQGTRHNIGWEVLAQLERRHAADPPKPQFHGDVLDIRLGEQRVMLLAPTTFMNLSGKSVLAARDFYKIPHNEILVVCDDLALPPGKLRVRGKGSAGGQKGLADIIRCLGDDAIPRLRIGIGATPSGWNTPDYVLGKFTKAERAEMDVAVVEAADAVELWVREGTDVCMNKYNGR